MLIIKKYRGDTKNIELEEKIPEDDKKSYNSSIKKELEISLIPSDIKDPNEQQDVFNQKEDEKVKQVINKTLCSKKFFIIFMTTANLFGIGTLFMNYFKIFCLMNFDDKIATSFSGYTTIVLVVSQVSYGL